MDKYRYEITYGKTGSLKYIAHLDLVNVFDRALRRCQLPLYYTQGFNQKIKMSFKSAHALGKEIESDVFGIFLLEDDFDPTLIAERMNAVLPKGICVHHVAKG